MALTKVLVIVKTYPTLSTKHIETVCTAGFREDGTWIRIYPVPFRMLNETYSKWQWIEADLEQNLKHDDRPESYHIRDIESLRILEKLDMNISGTNWLLRRQWIEKGKRIYTNMTELINSAKSNTLSLAVLKPSEIIDFVCEKREDDTTEKRALLEERLRIEMAQTYLFDDKALKKNFILAKQIPYKFSYRFKTDDGKKRKLMIEDWETSMLYLNCLKKCNGNESIACSKVRDKYLKMAKNEIHLIMGTTFEWHRKKSHNPFVIIGVFAPPFKGDTQLSFDF
ncbi:MAG: hypothetical protein E7100_08530 [Bacteroidaceae bacterium]|jgi:hypothetical protein|nr:hypothetical protein [Bacteroidaceae bacterium]